MMTGAAWNEMTIDRSAADAAGFNPYYHPIERTGQGMLIDGLPYVDCASNDYLGLAIDPRVIRAVGEAAGKFGASLCGTPIASGYARVMQDLESRLALFCGLEGAVIFPSCYQANCALFGAIVDSRDVILVDHYAHASLVQGIRASGCRIKPFLHNDMSHLERQLASLSGFRRVLVVTESVFSTEGSVAPLDMMVSLCERYGAVPVVDDSHGIGVLGHSGRGILQEKGIGSFAGIYTASLGKALGNAGGMIGGPAQLIDFLRYSCAGLIYSTALPPSCCGGVVTALDILHEEFAARKERLLEHRARVASALQTQGLTVTPAESPIVSVRCGSAQATFTLARKLFERGIVTTPFVTPSVPVNEGCIRMIAGAGLDNGAIDHIEAVIASLEGVG